MRMMRIEDQPPSYCIDPRVLSSRPPNTQCVHQISGTPVTKPMVRAAIASAGQIGQAPPPQNLIHSPGWHQPVDWGSVKTGAFQIPNITVPSVAVAPLFDSTAVSTVPHHDHSSEAPSGGVRNTRIRTPAQVQSPTPGQQTQDLYGHL